MSLSNSGGDVIAQAVIDPNTPAFLSQFGFKGSVTAVSAGAFSVSLNAEMNYAASAARQVIATLETPDATPAAYQCAVQQSADAQAINIVIFNGAGAVITAPPAGSRVQLTVIRAALPQG